MESMFLARFQRMPELRPEKFFKLGKLASWSLGGMDAPVD